MTDAPNTAGLSPRSAPAKDRPARPVPPRIAEILGIVTILAGYGRHLAATLEHRAVARGFATIAQYFGTGTLDTIQAHILRGLMRAIALERLLLLRAARGRDLRTLTPRTASCRAPAAQDAAYPAQAAASAPPEALTPEQAAAAQEAARQAAVSRAEARLARRIARDRPLTFATLPSMEEIEAEVRRSPLGRTIALICRDLGISPSLCDGAFWGRISTRSGCIAAASAALCWKWQAGAAVREGRMEAVPGWNCRNSPATASAACWASASANPRSIRSASWPHLGQGLPLPRPGRPDRRVPAVRVSRNGARAWLAPLFRFGPGRSRSVRTVRAAGLLPLPGVPAGVAVPPPPLPPGR